MTNGSLMKVKSIAESSMHQAIIGLENQFSVFLREAIYTCFTVFVLDEICLAFMDKVPLNLMLYMLRIFSFFARMTDLIDNYSFL